MSYFSKLTSRFSKDIGIDLGTANTVVYCRGEGVVLNEPSVVAIDPNTKEVLAIGQEAYNMVGRTPGDIIAVRPMKDGVIADFAITEAMIRHFVRKVLGGSRFPKPRILVGVPSGITGVEKRAVLDAGASSGAKETFLIEEPMAAAIGENVDVIAPQGHLVVDIGGGTTEIAVISMGGIVNCKSLRIAGDELDQAIIAHCKKTYNLLIGDRMGEKVKMEIGSAYPYENEGTMMVRGRDLVSGLPKTQELSAYEIRDSLSEAVTSMVEALRITLEKTPPELSADIMEKGILMTGGGSLLRGLDAYFQEETDIPVRVSNDPLSAVAFGTGKILEESNLRVLMKSTTDHRGF